MMETNDDQAGFTPAPEATAPLAEGLDSPPSYWNQVVNSPPGGTLVTVPGPGNLWVYYEFQAVPPQQIGIWHQGGSVDPIQPGENNIAVGPGDMLFYVLADPANDSIKLAYQLT
jgi:hypothetical protein